MGYESEVLRLRCSSIVPSMGLWLILFTVLNSMCPIFIHREWKPNILSDVHRHMGLVMECFSQLATLNMSGLDEVSATAAWDCFQETYPGSTTAVARIRNASGEFLAESNLVAHTSMASSANVAERFVSLSPQRRSLQILVCVKSTVIEVQSCKNVLYNSIKGPEPNVRARGDNSGARCSFPQLPRRSFSKRLNAPNGVI